MKIDFGHLVVGREFHYRGMRFIKATDDMAIRLMMDVFHQPEDFTAGTEVEIQPGVPPAGQKYVNFGDLNIGDRFYFGGRTYTRHTENFAKDAYADIHYQCFDVDCPVRVDC